MAGRGPFSWPPNSTSGTTRWAAAGPRTSSRSSRKSSNSRSTICPRLDWPIRSGVHQDSGFALALALDYARAVGHAELEGLVTQRARDYYLKDTAYPVAYEPSGNDFFSSGLNEADLMRRVLKPDRFSGWLNSFLPGLKTGQLGNLLKPARVSDPTDGHLIHLAGLNFSRAWTMNGIASVLPADAPRGKTLRQAAAEHLEAGLAYVTSGHYEGEHWLASFAVYALSTMPE